MKRLDNEEDRIYSLILDEALDLGFTFEKDRRWVPEMRSWVPDHFVNHPDKIGLMKRLFGTVKRMTDVLYFSDFPEGVYQFYDHEPFKEWFREHTLKDSGAIVGRLEMAFDLRREHFDAARHNVAKTLDDSNLFYRSIRIKELLEFLDTGPVLKLDEFAMHFLFFFDEDEYILNHFSIAHNWSDDNSIHFHGTNNVDIFKKEWKAGLFDKFEDIDVLVRSGLLEKMQREWDEWYVRMDKISSDKIFMEKTGMFLRILLDIYDIPERYDEYVSALREFLKEKGFIS